MHDDASPSPEHVLRTADHSAARLRILGEQLAAKPDTEWLATEFAYGVDALGGLAREVRGYAASNRAALNVLGGFLAADRDSRLPAAAGQNSGPVPVTAPRHAARPGPFLRIIKGTLPVWLAALGSAAAAGLRAHRHAAAAALAAGTLAVPVTVAAISTRTAPFETRVQAAAAAPAAPAAATGPAPRSTPVHGHRRHHRHAQVIPLPGPHRPRPVPHRPPAPSPGQAGHTGTVTPVSLILHAGPDGQAMLVLRADGGTACWSATVTGPVIVQDPPGSGCIGDGQTASIPVSAAGEGTISVASGSQLAEVTVLPYSAPRASPSATA